jgi:hypothetical protein
VNSGQNTGSGGNGGGNGGSGGSTFVPTIDHLVTLQINPATQTIQLMLDANNRIAPGTADYTASGMMDDGSTQDVTTMVAWSSGGGLGINNGHATARTPGKYTITAKAKSSKGEIDATAALIASFKGSFTGDGYDSSATPSLDGTASGNGATIAYPLDGSLFPSNLGPIYVQITKPNASATSARLHFTAGDSVDITWYGRCETTDANGALPGTGCYVKLPVDFTALFIGASEATNITLTARVGGGSGAAAETPSIQVAWANVGVTGGLYYWSVISPVAVTGYTTPDPDPNNNPMGLGTGIMRYDFSKDNPAPQLVWTDRGPPPFSPTTVFAPQASDPGTNGPAYGGHCVGCHAISNDGKYMALTIGGSSSVNGANFSVLDITMRHLLNINPAARTDQNSSPTQNPTDYWNMFRKDTFATETSWSKDGTASVSMYLSKLYINAIMIDPVMGTGVATRQGLALPSWGEYQSDPFWSQDGKLLVFTSFPAPDTDPNNPTGLNGDMKTGGTIAIADANGNTVMDNARPLVPRQSGVTNYYPAISNDSKLVVYNQSTCSAGTDPVRGTTGNPYGNKTCDGYDDSTATLWLTDPMGRAPIKLANANTGGSSNSWPRFSPDNGMFRGQRLYWVAFSSRRPYGLQVNYNPPSASAAKPQLWFAAVTDGGEVITDPSFAPVWLPGQNSNQSAPNGNHVPQWVAMVVPIPE